MKLMVAAETPENEDDFVWTIAGELVHFPVSVCSCPDCGCERAMSGFVSHKATTCVLVRDIDIDAATYTDLLWDSLIEGGWVSEGSTDDREWAWVWAEEHMSLAASLPLETTLHVRHDQTLSS